MTSRPQPSMQLGKYAILEELGRGGFGVVHRALNTSLDLEVAVKVIHPQLLVEPQFVERFFREARIAANLRHPNIVSIYDIVEAEGRFFIVMELLQGQNLQQLIAAQGALDLVSAVRILQQVGEALDFAHGRDVLHRDVKPSNIIVRDDGHATLTDFGLAKAHAQSGLTSSGQTVGTLTYMAPEQLDATFGEVGKWTDVYALGVVAYQMLGGHPPFEGSSSQIIAGHLMRDPPVLDGLPPEAMEVLRKTLGKRPEARYGSASDLLCAFQECLERGTAEVRAARAQAVREAMVRVERALQAKDYAAVAQTAADLRKLAGTDDAALALIDRAELAVREHEENVAQAEALAAKARELAQQEDWNAAASAMQRAMDLLPEKSDYRALHREYVSQRDLAERYDQARQALQQGEWADGLAALRALPADYRDVSMLLEQAGAVRERAAATDRAREAVRRALEEQDYPRAQKAATALLDLAPDDEDAQQLAAEVDTAVERHEAKIKELREAAEKAEEVGDWQQAVSALRALASMFPGDDEAFSQRLEVAQREVDWAQALQAARQALAEADGRTALREAKRARALFPERKESRDVERKAEQTHADWVTSTRRRLAMIVGGAGIVLVALLLWGAGSGSGPFGFLLSTPAPSPTHTFAPPTRAATAMATAEPTSAPSSMPTRSPTAAATSTARRIPTATSIPLADAVVLSGGAEVREGPSSVYVLTMQLSGGAELTVVGRSVGGQWLQIRTEQGVTGWVRREYLEENVDGDSLPVATPPPSPTPLATATLEQPQTGATRVLEPAGITVVYVPGGEFTMGLSDNDPDAYDDEKPAHGVHVDSFWIGQTEVTNDQYERFMEAGGYTTREYWTDAGWQWKEENDIKEPGYWRDSTRNGAQQPVAGVSWYEAEAYARWAGGRLPTEAEWEYAARGGPLSQGYRYAGSDDANAVAWYGGNSGGVSHPVGQKQRNELGLYDMSGNAWEWCADWYDGDYYEVSPARNPQGPASGSYRVLRGGSWSSHERDVRCAGRNVSGSPVFRGNLLGFRVAE